MNLRRNQIISVIILSICFIIGLLAYSIFIPVVSQESGVVYELKPGTSKKTLIKNLADQGIVTHPILFALYAYSQFHAQLKTGEYLFPQGATLHSIFKQVTTGSGFMSHPFTLVPGWTFYQLRQELLKAPGLRHTTANMTDYQVMQKLGHPEMNPEGEFFPDTYYYAKGIQDIVILKHAFQHMQSKLKEAWDHKTAGLPYQNAYQALIGASLIEKEAYLASEREIISGVLINRLHHNMLLQFDPTVIYGMGQRYLGKIHKEDLVENTPYNTYLHKGLPPTPIAMPSQASIDAAMHPQKNDYYYFVAQGNGSHHFSKTLSEHNEAVKNAKKTSSLDKFINPRTERFLLQRLTV